MKQFWQPPKLLLSSSMWETDADLPSSGDPNRFCLLAEFDLMLSLSLISSRVIGSPPSFLTIAGFDAESGTFYALLWGSLINTIS